MWTETVALPSGKNCMHGGESLSKICVGLLRKIPYALLYLHSPLSENVALRCAILAPPSLYIIARSKDTYPMRLKCTECRKTI